MSTIDEKAWNAIQKNDIVAIRAMMDDCHAFKGAMSTILMCASVMSLSGGLDEAMAGELIDRLAMEVDIVRLLRCVVACAGIEAKDIDAIPEEIRVALGSEEKNDDFIHAIGDLDSATFTTLLGLIAEDKIENINRAFYLPIIRRLYKDEVIDGSVLLAYMALCLRKTIEERLAERYAAFTVLSDDPSSLSSL